MKTKVFLTVDMEFSIAGAFTLPERRVPIAEQSILCRNGNEGFGLDFLLATLDEFAIRSTFFVEPLNTNLFGDAPMATQTERVARAGHDIQLHLHPCWTYFKHQDWKERLKSVRPSDHMNGRSVEQLVDWIGEGIGIFQRWGYQPLALRTGSMLVDIPVYKAMEACGLFLSSNVATGVFEPLEPELRLFTGIHDVGKVREACVLTYQDHVLGPKSNHRALTIAGASWMETKYLLKQARAAQMESVVILTHPFEFSKHEFATFKNAKPNRATRHRLRKLCEFLADHPEDYEISTFTELASRGEGSVASPNTLLTVPLPLAAMRMAENALNHFVRAY